MVEILEENEIKVDNTIKNITYTGNIVDSDTQGDYCECRVKSLG